MPERLALCEWCRRRRVERRGARYCSHACRQRAYERRRQVGLLLADAREANRHVLEAIEQLRALVDPRHSVDQRTQQEVPE